MPHKGRRLEAEHDTLKYKHDTVLVYYRGSAVLARTHTHRYPRGKKWFEARRYRKPCEKGGVCMRIGERAFKLEV